MDLESDLERFLYKNRMLADILLPSFHNHQVMRKETIMPQISKWQRSYLHYKNGIIIS